jgi:hypothetical protein
MVAINFKPRFAEEVENGSKRQTIRRKLRCATGDKLQLYVNQRRPECRKIADAVCTGTAPIVIIPGHIIMDTRILTINEADALARADGFKTHLHMISWFLDTYDLPFEGHVIRFRLEDE